MSTQKKSRTLYWDQKPSPNWENIAFVVPVHLIGISAWPVFLWVTGSSIGWQEVSVFVFMFVLGVIGIDVGYHRGFSHRSFKMSPVLRFLSLFGGASVAEGSVLTWVSDHRWHHRFEDTPKDPYNIKRGFWWAHMGWILFSPTTNDFSNCQDLLKDRWIRHQNKYYVWWFLISGFGLPLALGFMLGRPLECFLLGGLFRLVLLNHFTYLINSYAHYFGRRPYSTDITARDSLICAILASGEGWHNFHHKFPFDYRNGHKFYHYDPTKWFIYFGQFVGLTSDLKKTSAAQIYKARIETKMKAVEVQNPRLKAVTEQLERALENWQALQTEWALLKSNLAARKSERVQEIKLQLSKARADFFELYHDWRQSLKTPAPKSSW